MDFSLAVFSTQGSPFLETSRSRSHHYHPSQAKPLSQEQRSMALSPSRLQHRDSPSSPQKAEMLSPPHPSFLPDSSWQEVKPPNSDSTSPFNESWPSTECGSSSLTPEGAKAISPEQASRTKTLVAPKPQDSASDSESVIARFIERFRYGQPTNRRERGIHNGRSAQFWWLDHSFPHESGIPKEASATSDCGQSEARPASLSPALDHSPSEESQESSTLDPETVNLQERADKLLQISTPPLSSWRPVSSEELSSDPAPTVTSAGSNLTGHAMQQHQEHQGKGSPCLMAHISKPCPSYKQEDDILFQWRLRRKREEISKAIAVLPPVAWQTQCSHPACMPNVMERAALKSPGPTDWKRSALVTSDYQPDGKFTIDEHPCYSTIPLRTGPSSKQPIEHTPLSARNVTAGRSKSNRELRMKEPVPVCLGSPPPPPPPAGTDRPFNRNTFHCAHQTVQPVEKSHIGPSGKRRPLRSERGRAKPAMNSGEPPANPTKQAVQHALGEVIAERLFCTPESPALHKDKLKRSSGNEGLKEAPPDPGAIPSHPQLLNMAARLLEQAEDSDGVEFEDDSLLQVLRAQRELLRSQLRAVDIRMAHLEDCHSDQNVFHR